MTQLYKQNIEAYNLILMVGYAEIEKGVSPFIFIGNLTKGKCTKEVAYAYYALRQDDQYHLMNAWIKHESARVIQAMYVGP